MKPKNFPGRKNKRRITAFAHRKMALSHGQGPMSMSETLTFDMHNLTTHIIAESTARAIRTKKRRENKI